MPELPDWLRNAIDIDIDIDDLIAVGKKYGDPIATEPTPGIPLLGSQSAAFAPILGDPGSNLRLQRSHSAPDNLGFVRLDPLDPKAVQV